ncbi:MAG: sugar ABC transporter substrate-binding protein [Lachnospiraceae bacterium]|nr:sugar ABC transporter substrate-binding protein [Lachnospiraceae bacterium]
MKQNVSTNKEQNSTNKVRRGGWVIAIMIALAVLIFMTVVALVIMNRQMNRLAERPGENAAPLARHYAFIAKNPSDAIFRSIFEGAKEEGSETGTIVEWFGEEREPDITEENLVEMAIAAKVDGIILEGRAGEHLATMIEKARHAGIPTVTVYRDCYGSARQSYVGVASYSYGREYARQIIRFAGKATHSALLFLDSNGDDSEQNIVCNGIRNTLSNEGNHLRIELETVKVNTDSTFSAEEDIKRTLLAIDKLPDIIICMDPVTTDCMYRAAVEYNLLDRISLLGFYTEKSTLEAIEKGNMQATVTVDFHKMGRTAVDALNEYDETAFISDMYTQEAETVNRSNLREYREQ